MCPSITYYTIPPLSCNSNYVYNNDKEKKGRKFLNDPSLSLKDWWRHRRSFRCWEDRSEKKEKFSLLFNTRLRNIYRPPVVPHLLQGTNIPDKTEKNHSGPSCHFFFLPPFSNRGHPRRSQPSREILHWTCVVEPEVQTVINVKTLRSSSRCVTRQCGDTFLSRNHSQESVREERSVEGTNGKKSATIPF